MKAKEMMCFICKTSVPPIVIAKSFPSALLVYDALSRKSSTDKRVNLSCGFEHVLFYLPDLHCHQLHQFCKMKVFYCNDLYGCHCFRNFIHSSFSCDYKFEKFLSSADGSAGKEPNNRTSNPMVQLFYGQYLAEGINEGNVPS